MKPGNVVILGATGFIGDALWKRFRAVPGWSVLGFGSSTLDLLGPDAPARLARAVNEDTVLIVAARAARGSDPLKRFGDDVALATNVATALLQQRVKHCIYFSSTAVYGDATSNLQVTEDTSAAPTSLYGAAKFAAECVLQQTGDKVNVPVLVLRPCMVYGPGDPSTGYGPGKLIASILRDHSVNLFGDGGELRPYLFIEDLVEITLALAMGNYQGAYNLAADCSHSFQEIVQYLREISQRDFRVASLPRNRPRTDQRIHPVKLQSVLPTLQFTPLKQGLKATLGASIGQDELARAG